MGTDREARALASGDTFEVEGQEYMLRPITAQHLCDLERQALKHYKREYLETISENSDLLPKGVGDKLVAEKMLEVARWDLEDLPQRDAYNVSRVPMTDAIRRWVEKQFECVPESDFVVRALVTSALDAGQLSPKDVKKLTGHWPIHGKVRYDQWWVTGMTAGQMSFVLSSIRYEHPEVTKEVVSNWPINKVVEAAKRVENVTMASMGNG